jgi:hypothetical protein
MSEPRQYVFEGAMFVWSHLFVIDYGGAANKEM